LRDGPGRSAGRLAWTEGCGPTLWQKWAERSLQAKPGYSSRSRSESDQPLFFLGREDFVLDVSYKPKQKKQVLRKILGKLIPFGWSPKEEI